MTTVLSDIICKNSIRRGLSQLTKKDKWNLYREKKELQFLDESVIENYQKIKLKTLLKAAYYTPYYKPRIDTLDISIPAITVQDLSKFPLLTKKIIREQRDNLLVNQAKTHRINYSSGSTLDPIKFYSDPAEEQHMWASMKVMDEMNGWYFGARTARLWGHKHSTGKERSCWNNTIYFNAYDMSEEKIKKLHQDLIDFQPEIIIASGSSIFQLASYLKSNNIRPAYPSISITSDDENLYPHMRKTIEETFSTKCFNNYGCRETGYIACECREHAGLHIFMDNVIVECLDQNTGEAVYDTPGELIITNLNNLCMPFIRYKVGDIGILSKNKCACGRQTLMLKTILGRNFDQILLKNKTILFGYDFNQCFINVDGLETYQFIQLDNDNFILNIVKLNNFCNVQFEEAIKKIQAKIGTAHSVQINFVESIPKPTSGKFQFFIPK